MRISDWRSDVCSSDLTRGFTMRANQRNVSSRRLSASAIAAKLREGGEGVAGIDLALGSRPCAALPDPALRVGRWTKADLPHQLGDRLWLKAERGGEPRVDDAGLFAAPPLMRVARQPLPPIDEQPLCTERARQTDEKGKS